MATTKTMRFCTATTTAATTATSETTETITLPNITTDNDDDNDSNDKNQNKYTYHRHEKLTSKLQSESNLKKLLPSSPCRFLLSKGKDGRKTKLSKDTVSVVQNNKDDNEGHDDKDDSDSADRIMIKYPKSGSTYKIRKEYLLPIIQDDNQIIVSPETDIYRKLCWIHTNQTNDNFIEIGCDFGFTSGNVICKNKLGIDKSKTSIDIAQKNYPTDQFLEIDVLEITLKEMEDILIQYQLQQQQDNDNNDDDDDDTSSSPNNNEHGRLVVAIDINGNRELNAVIQCLDRVLKCWKPKLVIVKSRSLYSKLIDMGY
ncbi:MAG: hypothetical protein ACI8RD_011389 [Bacillariaceae sp.]|jgi:hypothetical protein